MNTVELDGAAISDEQLLQQVVAHDASALQQLYLRHANAVYALANYILRDNAIAEELTQEIFLTVWNKAEQYRAEHARFRTWLLSITRYRAIDQLRQKRRRIQPSLSLDDTSIAEEQAPITEPIDTQRELHLLLRHLPPEQRLAIELCYFEGYTHEEIAAYLHIPLGTLKSRILLGLKKLREIMKEGK
ncbi:MAG: RNA polymerase sigma factor [Chloroflexota bacterium]|nr:MAG: RNA polymerase sigma factor [Chloroflexota bacterium]